MTQAWTVETADPHKLVALSKAMSALTPDPADIERRQLHWAHERLVRRRDASTQRAPELDAEILDTLASPLSKRASPAERAALGADDPLVVLPAAFDPDHPVWVGLEALKDDLDWAPAEPVEGWAQSLTYAAGWAVMGPVKGMLALGARLVGGSWDALAVVLERYLGLPVIGEAQWDFGPGFLEVEAVDVGPLKRPWGGFTRARLTGLDLQLQWSHAVSALQRLDFEGALEGCTVARCERFYVQDLVCSYDPGSPSMCIELTATGLHLAGPLRAAITVWVDAVVRWLQIASSTLSEAELNQQLLDRVLDGVKGGLRCESIEARIRVSDGEPVLVQLRDVEALMLDRRGLLRNGGQLPVRDRLIGRIVLGSLDVEHGALDLLDEGEVSAEGVHLEHLELRAIDGMTALALGQGWIDELTVDGTGRAPLALRLQQLLIEGGRPLRFEGPSRPGARYLHIGDLHGALVEVSTGRLQVTLAKLHGLDLSAGRFHDGLSLSCTELGAGLLAFTSVFAQQDLTGPDGTQKLATSLEEARLQGLVTHKEDDVRAHLESASADTLSLTSRTVGKESVTVEASRVDASGLGWALSPAAELGDVSLRRIRTSAGEVTLLGPGYQWLVDVDILEVSVDSELNGVVRLGIRFSRDQLKQLDGIGKPLRALLALTTRKDREELTLRVPLVQGVADLTSLRFASHHPALVGLLQKALTLRVQRVEDPKGAYSALRIKVPGLNTRLDETQLGAGTALLPEDLEVLGDQGGLRLGNWIQFLLQRGIEASAQPAPRPGLGRRRSSLFGEADLEGLRDVLELVGALPPHTLKVNEILVERLRLHRDTGTLDGVYRAKNQSVLEGVKISALKLQARLSELGDATAAAEVGAVADRVLGLTEPSSEGLFDLEIERLSAQLDADRQRLDRLTQILGEPADWSTDPASPSWRERAQSALRKAGCDAHLVWSAHTPQDLTALLTARRDQVMARAEAAETRLVGLRQGRLDFLLEAKRCETFRAHGSDTASMALLLAASVDAEERAASLASEIEILSRALVHAAAGKGAQAKAALREVADLEPSLSDAWERAGEPDAPLGEVLNQALAHLVELRQQAWLTADRARAEIYQLDPPKLGTPSKAIVVALAAQTGDFVAISSRGGSSLVRALLTGLQRGGPLPSGVEEAVDTISAWMGEQGIDPTGFRSVGGSEFQQVLDAIERLAGVRPAVTVLFWVAQLGHRHDDAPGLLPLRCSTGSVPIRLLYSPYPGHYDLVV